MPFHKVQFGTIRKHSIKFGEYGTMKQHHKSQKTMIVCLPILVIALSVILCTGCIEQDAESNISELLEEAHEHALSGRYNESIDIYTTILENDPENDAIWLRKGMALEYTGRHDESVECYNKAVEIYDNRLENDPENYTLWFSKGNVLSSYLNKENEAIVSYNKALEISENRLQEEPDNVTTLMIKGGLLGITGRYDEALECYDRVLATDSDNKTMAIAYLAKGSILSNDFGMHEEAIEYYDRALEIYPDGEESWIIWLNKGHVLTELYRYEDAIAVFDEGLKLYPENTALMSAIKIAEKDLEEGRIAPEPSDTISDYFFNFNDRKARYIYSLLSADLKERLSLEDVEDLMDEYRSNNIRMVSSSRNSVDKMNSGNTSFVEIKIEWDVQGNTITTNHNISLVFEDEKWKIDDELITMDNTSQQ